MKYNFFLILILLLNNSLFSQDIHFSQQFVDRLYFNPSKIGDINDYDYRLSIQRRSQWKSVAEPFSTFSSTIERKNLFKNINIGAQFFNDKSGNSKLNTNQLNIALNKKFLVSNINYLSLGFLIGIGQKNIDLSSLIFHDKEALINNNFIYHDLGVGFNFDINYYNNIKYNFGVSSYHLNKPSNSFNADETIRLPIKNNYNINIQYNYLKDILFITDIIYTNQLSSREILIGNRAEINLESLIISPLIYCRLNDAIILGLGVKQDNISANISYDINISNLSIASNNKGGFEFSLLYYWKNKKKLPKIKKEICPKYL
tara:strand:- start:13644 stop:14591 length:948 start_codon:yes stop_codon:yes gene_type:complete